MVLNPPMIAGEPGMAILSSGPGPAQMRCAAPPWQYGGTALEADDAVRHVVL